jgi:RNase P subunit RPR2
VSPKCDDCGAEIVYGKPHKMRETVGSSTTIVTQCQECAEYFAWACWPEDYGPCPYQLRRAGTA